MHKYFLQKFTLLDDLYDPLSIVFFFPPLISDYIVLESFYRLFNDLIREYFKCVLLSFTCSVRVV